MDNGTAFLSNRDGYTVFEFGGREIRFAAPRPLEHYTAVKTWDDGYLVVSAKYAHNTDVEEEYIDLRPILSDLYFEADEYLRPIRKVEIRHV